MAKGGAGGMGGMKRGTAEGLKRWGKEHGTDEIKESLEEHEVTPEGEGGALAAWVRRKSLGMSKGEFAKYGARKRKSGGGCGG